MRLPQSLVLTATAGFVAAASLGVIGYRAWTNLPGAAPSQLPSASSAPPSSALPPSAPSSSAPQPSSTVLAQKAPAMSPGAAAQLGASVAAIAPPADGAAGPSFDIVRVEPTGEAVIAGRAPAHAQVILTDNGQPLNQTQADEAGQFVIAPLTLSQGGHQLALQVARGPGALTSSQSVTVLVPKAGSDKLVVALTAPGQPTRVLADGAGASAALSAAPAASVGVGANEAAKPAGAGQAFIQSVEVGQGGGFFASGTAQPGSSLRIYLNNAVVANAIADAAGRWSLRVEKGLTPGAYSVRADAVDAKGAVLSRAEVPLQFSGFAKTGEKTAETSGGATAAKSTNAAAAGAGANVIVADLPTVQVTHGDNLWGLSRKLLGSGMRYTLIYAANSRQIRNRNLIYPGQIFVVPKS